MPGAGPILLFDKSALQSLSVDEAVWLDTFYFPCVTPLFFVETLADLEKEVQKGRSPEDVVGNLAEKTPLGGGINIHHQTLSANELLGAKFELRHCPVLSGGAPVTTRDGRRGVVFDTPPEAMALTRWQNGDFLQVERDFAKTWRDALSGIDLDELFQNGRELIKRFGRPPSLLGAKAMAESLLRKPGARYVTERLRAMRPADLGRAVLARWEANGKPPIKSYAPYTAHMLLVDLVFCLGLGADLIGRERLTNAVDIAYLYYLPFCMAFTSRDRLHERTAPLFLDDEQVFIKGDELKADLAKLDEHYSKLSDEEKLKGVMSFAHYPPLEDGFMTSKLWDRLMRPEWREWAGRKTEPKSKQDEAKIIAELNEIADAPRDRYVPQGPLENANAVVIERRVPVFRGKWRMVPPNVENAARE